MAPETMIAGVSQDAEKKDSQTPPAATRTEKFVFGIPQDGLTQKERQVPLDEPPPLPQNSELTYIGKPTTRWDGPQKVMGSGKYTADVQLPGMLYARMVGATIPHGRIISIDTIAAEKLPGVKAVHIIEHTYGMAELRDPNQEPRSKYPVIRYAGQPIAGAAAISPQVAADAAALIKVTYDSMPFVVDKQEARASDAPLVFPGPADAAGTAGGGGGPKNVLVMDANRCRKAAVVMGVAAPTPIRSQAAEEVLTGATVDENTARAAAKAAMQKATPLSQNGYKIQLFQTAIYRTILLAAGQMQRDPSAVG